MDSFPLIMLLAVLSLVTIQYLLEVHVGSATSMYDAESGLLSTDGPSRKSSPGQFLGRVVPLELAAFGLPLLAHDLLSGLLLILLAPLLFCLNGKESAWDGRPASK